MKLARHSLLPILLLFFISWVHAAAPPRMLVVCAPGFPGDTVEAQPTMDALARVSEQAAKWKTASLNAAYFSSEADGESRLKQADAALALVTLPFFHKHRDDLHLEPRLRSIGESAADEVWSLVARRGAITSPASLDGWEIVGVPAFAPAFVRGPVLGSWGSLPSGARITFTSRAASSLLKAASGEKLAVLLDSEQTAALPSHPRAADLEIVTASKPMPASLLCTIAGRGGREIEALVAAMSEIGERPGGRDILDRMRVTRFVPIEPAKLAVVLGQSR